MLQSSLGDAGLTAGIVAAVVTLAETVKVLVARKVNGVRRGNGDNPGHSSCRFSGTAIRDALEPLRETVHRLEQNQTKMLVCLKEIAKDVESAVRGRGD